MSAAKQNRLLTAALAYARRGWAVFPLDGKRPFGGTHGHHDATTDPKVIAAMWRDYPDANVGIRCDSATGPIVVDVDGPDGEDLVASLDLPPTREATSGRGRHLYFAPDGQALKRTIKLNGAKLDVLGDGGYVVAPPSIHPKTGRPYAWASRAPLAPLPPAVRQLVPAPATRQPAVPLPGALLEGHKTESVYRRYAIVAEADLREGVAKLASMREVQRG